MHSAHATPLLKIYSILEAGLELIKIALQGFREANH